jgi:molybdopterin-guanine dinucleotide biosynthesis protein A/wyosine [tRNA(Phe)-imidazoG37] synthetase (radical SAM superfamily)
MAYCGGILEMELSAVILAGGESKRMGRDKALIELEGQTLLALAVEKVRRLGVAEIFISGRPGRDYSAVKYPVLFDLEPGFGPLGGIERALHECHSPLLLVLAVDLPHLTTEFLRKLMARCDPLTGVVPELEGRLEPLAAIYPKRCHQFASNFVARSRPVVCQFAEACLEERAVRKFELTNADAVCFSNWNSPADIPTVNPARKLEQDHDKGAGSTPRESPKASAGLNPAPAATDAASGRPLDADPAFGRPRDFLGNRFVYAAISQRAHGLSIGINLNPDKKCNFDCVYCEVNRDEAGFSGPVDIGVMAAELAGFLERVRQKTLRELEWFRNVPSEFLELKEVALSGHGEPTLCPNFTEVVEAVVHLRARRLHPFKIVLITNTTGLDTPEVQRGLRQLTLSDEVWVKLDAGTQEYMDKVNRPDIPLQKVLENILTLGRKRPVIVQSLFPQIKTEEPSDQEIDQYSQRLLELKTAGANISKVQIYSSHRPPHRPDCAHLPLNRLSYIARRVRAVAGLRAEVF